jgi:hypothetical protein
LPGHCCRTEGEGEYAQSNLAVALDMQNKREEAMQQYEQTLRVVPVERQDSVPQIKERILQLRNKERDGNGKVLLQKNSQID